MLQHEMILATMSMHIDVQWVNRGSERGSNIGIELRLRHVEHEVG
jgi:hypothetical protein